MPSLTQNAIIVNLTVTGDLSLPEGVKDALVADLLVDLEDRVTTLVDKHLEIEVEDATVVDIEWEPAPHVAPVPADARVRDVAATLNTLIAGLVEAGLVAPPEAPEGEPAAADAPEPVEGAELPLAA